MKKSSEVFILFLLLSSLSYLHGKETTYLDSSLIKIETNDNLEMLNLDSKNAEFKMEKKNENFDYAVNYKLSKNGYENLENIESYYNEDLYNLLFSSNIYFYDNIWLNLNMNYRDSLKSILETTYKRKSVKQEAIAKLYYKPNSSFSTNISLENIDNSIDYDKLTNQTSRNTNNKKVSFNMNTDLNLFTLNTSLFHIIKENNYLYKSNDSDDYFKSTQEVYRGLELSLSKEIFENLKFTTTGKLTNIEILNSNLDDLVGKTPMYSPKKELDFKVEYLFKDVKFTSKINYVGSRYSDSLNSEKLDAYSIASLGASFDSKINDENVKIDFNVKNILDKDYYLYSQTKGDSRNYSMNLTMNF